VPASDFKRTSRALWEAMAPEWDERHPNIEEVARPVTEQMLERLAPAPGDVVLELAAGTGIVGFAAAARVGPAGRVIVSDFSHAMVQAAQSRATRQALENVDCRVLDAEQLALPDQEFDGVLCRWGSMLMGNAAAAFAETRRVLRRNGRLCCAVFASPQHNPWAALPIRVLEDRGHLPPPHAGAPGIFGLADRGRLSRLFTEAGFREPQCSRWGRRRSCSPSLWPSPSSSSAGWSRRPSVRVSSSRGRMSRRSRPARGGSAGGCAPVVAPRVVHGRYDGCVSTELLRAALGNEPVVTFAALQLLSEKAVWLALLEGARGTLTTADLLRTSGAARAGGHLRKRGLLVLPLAKVFNLRCGPSTAGRFGARCRRAEREPAPG
jgi:SAM-dependent methyltransferase